MKAANCRLAKDLILRMCNVNPQFRYSAALALKHPWITKKLDSPIPLTMYEEATRKRICNEIGDVFKSVFFAAMCRECVVRVLNVGQS